MGQSKLIAWVGFFSSLLSCVPLVHAKPVSYKGSVGIMGENSHNGNRLMVSYSPSARYALAGHYLREMSHEFYIPTLSALIYRWNLDDSQANLYLSLGPAFQKVDSEFQRSQFVETQADWENRDLYFEYSNMFLRGYSDQTAFNKNSNRANMDKKKLRLGLSPFRGEYTELNIWYVAQLETKLNSKFLEKTQLLRFFYKNVLWEIGADFKGGYQFNYMINL